LKLRRDGWTGLAVLAASLFLFALTLGLKDNPLVPIGPGFYPRIVLGITAVLAVAMIVFSFLEKDREERKGSENYFLVFAVFLVFGVYVAALPFLGFRISTLLFMAALQATLEPPKGAKGWLVIAATAFITTLVAYILFERYLTVLLPRGLWTNF
jgi:putative tricarboxylic transport membrane protein